MACRSKRRGSRSLSQKLFQTTKALRPPLSRTRLQQRTTRHLNLQHLQRCTYSLRHRAKRVSRQPLPPPTNAKASRQPRTYIDMYKEAVADLNYADDSAGDVGYL